MTQPTVGMSGGPVQTLSPLRRPTTHMRGPYRAIMAPTQTIHQAGAVPEELFLALLTKAPNLDGLAWVELEAAGYERQKVTMMRGGMLHVVNTGEPVVTLEEPVAGVTHVGLFTAEGVLAFYGTLIGMGYSANAPTEFRFPASSLQGKALGLPIAAAG